MKIAPVLLGCSLAANAALIVALIAGVSGDTTPSSTKSARAAAAPARVSSTALAGVDPELWNKLPSGDWSALVASLRAKGFPLSIIRAIVSAQVDEGFRDRRKALEAAMNNVPFWKNPIPDPQTLAAQRALSREEQKMLKDIFGTDASADDPRVFIAVD